ncbi:hypothetical protein HFD88_005768 [Aspergillus terreus]|nr:hypothetical protein HFD88_005768 [Aspergillus terreus]
METHSLRSFPTPDEVAMFFDHVTDAILNGHNLVITSGPPAVLPCISGKGTDRPCVSSRPGQVDQSVASSMPKPDTMRERLRVLNKKLASLNDGRQQTLSEKLRHLNMKLEKLVHVSPTSNELLRAEILAICPAELAGQVCLSPACTAVRLCEVSVR